MEKERGAGSVREQFELLVRELDEDQQQETRKMASESETGVDFTKPWEYADITFLVEGKRLYANKMILSMWSPVFAAMFRDNFKEKNAKEIELPGKEHDNVLAMLKVLHPPNEEICEKRVEALLALSEEYRMPNLTDRCEAFLKSQTLSVRIAVLADQYHLTKLLPLTQDYLHRVPLSCLQKQKEYQQLKTDTLIQVLLKKCEHYENKFFALGSAAAAEMQRRPAAGFRGMHMLCEDCMAKLNADRWKDCNLCKQNCSAEVARILRSLDWLE